MKAFDDFITVYPDALEVSEAKLIQKQSRTNTQKKSKPFRHIMNSSVDTLMVNNI